MSPRRVVSAVSGLVAAAALGGCSTPSAEQLVCDLTRAMADEVQADGSPSGETVSEFIDIAPDVDDPALRPVASQAASDLAADPAQALDSLASLYDACVEQGHDGQAGPAPRG